jgi:2-polyprenyl-3-methyl-5-hydroxy-6-metoxy-1,4-benzoquinol methylase
MNTLQINKEQNNPTCPISGSHNVVKLQTVSIDDLELLYQKALKTSIQAEFGQVKEISFYHCLDSDLKFFYPMVTGSEKFYESLQKFDWYYLDEKEEYEYASKWIKQHHSVLEIGSGKGAFSSKIVSKDYTGLEFSTQAIKYASEHKINLINESIESHVHNHQNKYDVVCSFQVLEHISDIQSFVAASISCVKSGGYLIYSIPSADSFVSSWTNNVLNMPPHHMTWWSDKALTYLADHFNLEVIGLHHDKLSDLHKKPYSSLLLQEALKRQIGWESNKILDLSIGQKIINKVSAFGGKLIEKGLSNSKLCPLGHSVTIVYQKK